MLFKAFVIFPLISVQPKGSCGSGFHISSFSCLKIPLQEESLNQGTAERRYPCLRHDGRPADLLLLHRRPLTPGHWRRGHRDGRWGRGRSVTGPAGAAPARGVGWLGCHILGRRRTRRGGKVLLLVGGPVGGGRRLSGRSEAVAGDGAAGDRLVHLLGREVGRRHEVACHLATLPTTATAATVAVLEVQLLMVNRLEHLGTQNKDKSRIKGKGRHCSLEDRICSIPCRATCFALGLT